MMALTAVAFMPALSASYNDTRCDEAAKKLETFYNPLIGMYSYRYWNSAVATNAIIDYMSSSGHRNITLEAMVADTYTVLQVPIPKVGVPGFISDYYDDMGWWGLTWSNAYEASGQARFLQTAIGIFDDMTGGWDSVCGGGLWWTKKRTYKNAIPNELFLSLAARLWRITGNQTFGDWALKEWAWFRTSGMVNGQNLINDGLDIGNDNKTCVNNNATVWSYNQGTLLGGLTDLYLLTNNSEYREAATSIARAAIAHLTDKVTGTLTEPGCEPSNTCEPDGVQFKGIFMRNLKYLDKKAAAGTFSPFIRANADLLWANRNAADNALPLIWGKPYDGIQNGGRQSSGLDALNAICFD
jgi:predicted alpha-1,6-mannanase (GH76 family)